MMPNDDNILFCFAFEILGVTEFQEVVLLFEEEDCPLVWASVV